ncbi:MAG: autotransporter domain-containing protein, partial [Reyranella sp.]|nr:autotransporter domain-containing protein [Reyranella sp.]
GGTGGAAATGGGGGGAGLGGAVFVQQGGTFNIAGAFNVSGGTVTAGAGGGTGGATAGSAFGAGIFLQGNGTVNIAPGAGVTQTISNAIADQTGSGGTGGNAGAGAIAKSGAGTLVLSAANTFTGGTTVTGGLVNFAAANNFGSGSVALNGGGLQWATGTTTDISSQLAALGAGGGTFDTNGNNVSFGTALNGGALTKTGSGTLTFTTTNTYSGATIVNAGMLQAGAANAFSATSAHTVVAGGTLALNNFNQTIGSLAGAGGVALGSATLTAGGDNTSTTYSGVLSGTGGLTKNGSGTLTLSGVNTYNGATTVNAGMLVVNGSLASVVTLSGGTLGGSGTIGGLTSNGGTIAPGNSIGTLNINGSFVQNGGIYQVEVNAAGQSDRINVTGAPGTATINGGTVQVIAEQGTYARNTTYTILTATGGVSGAYSTVTSNFAFLTSSLSYDANNVFLTLIQGNNAFAAGAQTSNQFAVGTALDRANASATGDFATVLNALSSLNTQQGPAALNAISGQQYSGFGTANVSSGLAFMNVLGQQMSLARGGSGGGTRVALAQACDVTCDSEQPSGFSVWGSAVGGTGSVAGSGNGNTSTLTYNLGGFAAGLDYRFDPRFLVGLGGGYASGNQWLGGFNGRGTSTSYNASVYASFTPGAFYLDALAGYGYNDNQMTRMIAIPGLASRTAMGQTGANQFLGQAEAGYRFNIFAPAAASLTPFARFQTTSVSQDAFTETGADSLNLSVAQQTTTSVRTVLGAELAGAIDMGWREKLVLQLRLGWAHEYADTSRPVTAAFAGAPGIGFTVYGAPPQRDGAVIGLAANTAIAQSTSIYLRYDGELGTGTDNHVLSAGLRMSW